MSTSALAIDVPERATEATHPTPPTQRGAKAKAPARRRWRLILSAIAALAFVWAFAPFVLVAVDAAGHHRVFLGVAGYYPMDGLQYLAWARQAHDGLIRNLYGSTADKALFIHPMWSLTGLLQGVSGIGPVLIMGFWKAVSALVLIGGCVHVVRRHLPAGAPSRRAAALMLALFGGLTPLVVVLLRLDYGQGGADLARAAGDLVPAMSLWDYSPLAIALGLMPLVIERLERIVAGRGARRTVISTGALGLLVAWLHPWQGMTLIAIAVGLALWRSVADRAGARSRVRRAPLIAVMGAIALPVIYYLILSRLDPGWATSEQNSGYTAVIPGLVALTCVIPLALIGLLAARRTGVDQRSRGLVLWVLATLLTIVLSPSGQYRALDGLAIPVAVLVVRAWPERGKRRGRLLATAALTGALAPLAYFGVGAYAHLLSPSVTAYTELAPSDVRAVTLAARAAGGGTVLAPAPLGTAIPALSYAVSWVGHPIWTPDYGERKMQSAALFAGGLTPVQVRRLIRTSRADALVEPCGSTGHLRSVLVQLGFHRATIGCARLYTRVR